MIAAFSFHEFCQHCVAKAKVCYGTLNRMDQQAKIRRHSEMALAVTPKCQKGLNGAWPWKVFDPLQRSVAS